MDELLIEFLAETSESLAALDDALLRLEREPGDAAQLADVFRLVHTIKGTCGFLNLPRLERVAHAAEDLLGAVRDGELQATSSLITVVLAALDRIKLIIAGIAATEQEPAGDDTALIAGLKAAKAAPDAPDAQPAGPAPAEAAGAEPASHNIRVAVDVLETLMVLVSELVLTRNQLVQLARLEPDSRYAAPLQRLSHLTSDLQEGVMKTRMQPIRHAWSKLPRMVRDLSAELGKRIDLVMLGEGTELDRQVLELIRDPLTHMVRNSADHGLESQAVRLAAGKPATGTITLNSFHEGGHIVIEVRDDGAGLPTARIRERALAQGLTTAGELAAMSDQQVQRFIFHPGLSTAQAVTAVSGRGVGMDVVKTNIQRLGGSVDLRSAAGQGTVFTVKIPLTLAIISALIVEAGGQRLALPQTCVAELVRAEQEGRPVEGGLVVERLHGAPVLRLRERLLPLVMLRHLLGLPPDEAATGALTVVVAVLGGLTLGLVVDQVFDTEEIVVKPVSPLLRHIGLFSGNTILGDGSVIMILDPNGLGRAVSAVVPPMSDHKADAPLTAAERPGDRTPMLLVRLADAGRPVAVPLGLVARIESIAAPEITRNGGREVMQYRGQLMPLINIEHHVPQGSVPVLVFSDRGRSVGLIVAEIVDVVEEQLAISLTAGRPGFLGTALIANRVTDVLDTGHWLQQGANDWFVEFQGLERQTVLVVEDSAFFRQLLVPTLSACGYLVTAVDSAAKALEMRDAASADRFDAIISDVEMPGIDGLQFATLLKQDGPWRHTPLLALSSRASPSDVSRGSAAGFDEYIGKFDRPALLQALRRQLAPAERQAA